MSDVSPRSSVLQEASNLIDGDRNAQYGPPTQDFQRTAAVLTALGYARLEPGGQFVNIVSSDVAILVMGVKMSRLMHSRSKRDNWVDLAGYAGCGFECSQEEGVNTEVREAIASLVLPNPLCEASGMSEADCVATDICDCFGVGDNRLTPPIKAADADLIRQHLPEGGWGHQSVAGWLQSLPADVRESVAIGVSQMLGHATGGNPEIARDAKAAAEVIEELTTERDEAQDAVAYLDGKLTDTRKRFDATLQELQQVKDELQDRMTHGSDANTITNLRDQLKVFAHHANDNVALRAKVRELEKELAASKATVRQLVQPGTVVFSSYNGEPTDAGT